MDTRKIKHQYFLSKWSPMIQECNNSGSTIREWCLKNNVDEKQYYYWQRRVREELCTSVVQAKEKETATVFAPLSIKEYQKGFTKPEPSRPDLVINIGEYRLEVGSNINPELLETVLKAIRHV
jgi:hypothetical protein